MYAYAKNDTGDKKATRIKTLLVRKRSIKSGHYCQLNNAMNFCRIFFIGSYGHFLWNILLLFFFVIFFEKFNEVYGTIEN